MTNLKIGDKHGRKYLKLSEAKDGMAVEVDSGFTCMEGRKIVFRDNQGLYLMCTHGKHYLDGQAQDGEHCVGVYMAPDEIAARNGPPRWRAEITYRHDAGERVVTHDLIEIGDLDEVIEKGPHWGTITRIEGVRINHFDDENLTVEQAAKI